MEQEKQNKNEEKNIKIKFRLSDKDECLRIKFKEQIHMRVR
jgi:hypothetical protein